MELTFWKMHGAANDFILVDDRARTFPADDRAWIARIAARRTGVGCDGVILIRPSEEADFRMVFFNPDGGEADLCGNGARCVARLAHELGAADRTMRFETGAGMIRAEILDDGLVRVHMPQPRDLQLNRTLDFDGREWVYHSIDTGVPHVVIPVEDAETVALERLGPRVRYDKLFAPAGTNVNVLSPAGEDAWRVRTYERGVEGETLACGTGLTACGVVAGALGLARPPVRLLTAGGDTVVIAFSLSPEGRAEEVTMTGPAAHVYTGAVRYEKSDS